MCSSKEMPSRSIFFGQRNLSTRYNEQRQMLPNYITYLTTFECGYQYHKVQTKCLQIKLSSEGSFEGLTQPLVIQALWSGCEIFMAKALDG